MPIYEALASWWVGAAVMASFVIFTLEGVNFNYYSTLSAVTRQWSPTPGELLVTVSGWRKEERQVTCCLHGQDARWLGTTAHHT